MKIYLIFLMIFCLGFVSAYDHCIGDSCCNNDYVICNPLGSPFICGQDDGWCDNYNNPSLSCIPGEDWCCYTSGHVADYSAHVCCPPDSPFYITSGVYTGYCGQWNTGGANNYYTKLAECDYFKSYDTYETTVEETCSNYDFKSCFPDKIAPWIAGWDNKGAVVGECGVNCVSASNCPSDEVVDTFCNINQIMKQTKQYSCSNYNCVSSEKTEVVETCIISCNILDDVPTCDVSSEKFKLDTNQLVAMETFAGGATLSKLSTRYPVIEFIYILPTIVVDADSNSLSTDVTIYHRLDEGQTIQIPTSQVYSLFYVIENNYQLPTICDVVDVTTGQCAKINPGIVIACSEGQLDPSLGLCVVQGESHYICPEGGYYDAVQSRCIFHPPLQAVCESPSVYNVNSEMCEYSPDTEYVCESGFVYDLNSDKCMKYPDKQINCPSSYAYDLNSDKCIRYPDERIICPVGTVFNLNTDRCEYSPPVEYVCQIGFNYNEITKKCELRPSNEIICDIGNYNEVKNICEYEPQISPVCSKGILTDIGNNNYACIYIPESVADCPTGTTYDITRDKCISYPDVYNKCPTGTTYNSNTDLCEGELQINCVQGDYNIDKNACVYSPNLEYLCINGDLTYVDSIPQCMIIPMEIIVCSNGWNYNSVTDRCERYPDYWEYKSQFNLENLWEDYKIAIIIFGALMFLILIGGGRK